MAVKMRLRREGKKKQPYYRVVVADVRSPRDGRFIEDIGYYQPLHEPSTIQIDRERALYWLRNGVQPTDAVVHLLRIEGIWEEFRPGDPGRDRSAKHAKRAAQAAERERKAREEAERAGRARAEAEAAVAKGPEPEEPAPVAEAESETVEQARKEDAQPDAQPPEEVGALDPADAEARSKSSASEPAEGSEEAAS
jgi:small subunit ribosomal protein S16